jgi:Uma2 family endonuclease
MSTALPALMTTEELLKLRPNKNFDRWLFRGELREKKLTKRNPNHSAAVAMIAYLLVGWLKTRPKPRGRVYSSEVYFRIRKDPDTNVGIDVALASPKQVARTSKKVSFIEGPPVLAVEVFSPYDKHKNIIEMIEEYLACGVKVLWVVDPYAETVTVYRPHCEPVMFNRDQHLTGGPELPGFKCKVSEIFEDA